MSPMFYQLTRGVDLLLICREYGTPIAVKLHVPTYRGSFFSQTGPSSQHHQYPAVVPDQFPVFLAKGVRPGNSPDLSPMENLRAIVRDKVDKSDQAMLEATLNENVH